MKKVVNMLKFTGPIQRVSIVPAPGEYEDKVAQAFYIEVGTKQAMKFNNIDDNSHPLILKYYNAYLKSPIKMNIAFSNISFICSNPPSWLRLSYNIGLPLKEIPHDEVEKMIDSCLSNN